MQGSESIILGFVHRARRREVSQDDADCSHVTPQSSMMEGVEAVVVGHGDIGLAFNQ